MLADDPPQFPEFGVLAVIGPELPDDPAEEAGGIFPALSTKKSTPYNSKRAGLVPGPWSRLALTTFVFKRAKML